MEKHAGFNEACDFACYDERTRGSETAMSEHGPVPEEDVGLFFDDDDTEKVFRAKVTGRHAITLPAQLCRELGIKAGDEVEFHLRYGTVTMRKAGGPPPLEARGILKDYR